MIKRVSTLALGLVALTLCGCGGSSGNSVSSKPEVLFLNASADAPNLSFRLDDGNFATNLAYLGTPGALREIDFRSPAVDGWDVSLHLATTGAEIDRAAIVFNQFTENIVVAHGLQNFGTEPLKRLRFSTFTIDRSRPNGNRAKLIIFHAAERSVGLDTTQITFKTPGDNALFSASPIGAGQSTVLNTDSGNLTFEARNTGTQGNFTTGSQTLAPGGVYLVLIAGLENDPTRPISINFFQLPSTL